MIWTRSGGRGDGPLLVLLHGLGANAEVWQGIEALLPARWPGGWLAVDLPGHGRSDWSGQYTFDAHADALAPLVPAERDVILLGHSMGGMVALALAGRIPRASRVIGFSIKTFWPPAHVEGMKEQSRRTPRVYADRAEAVQRYLKLSGLIGLVPADEPSLAAGITEVDGGWRVAQDPATYDFGVPDMPALLAAVPCPVTLGRGSEDHFVRDENLRELVPDPVTFAGLGHNPHLEDPASIIGLLG